MLLLNKGEFCDQKRKLIVC